MKKLSFGVTTLLGLMFATSGWANDVKLSNADNSCPAGYELMTVDDATANKDAVCASLGQWDIRRLAGGGSMDGPGYQCKIHPKDDRPLGGSICTVQKAQEAGAPTAAFYPMPATKPGDQPWCGDFENGVNWPATGHVAVVPRGFMKTDYQPQNGVQGALFAGPYQWGGERCGGWCVTGGNNPICQLQAFPVPAQKPQGQPWCGDFQNNVNWPAAGHTTVNPRGFPQNEYQPKGGVPGALFAGPYQWGGERCGGWCGNVDGKSVCNMR